MSAMSFMDASPSPHVAAGTRDAQDGMKERRSMAHLCDFGAVELRRLIGEKAISPVELLEDCLARIAAVNPVLNAVTATAIERARGEARVAETATRAGDPTGVLHGLPVGIKDLQETEGIVTSFG